MRRICRVDKNQKEIVKALREKGYSICHLHQLGGGVPDLLLGKNHKNYLIEVKNGKGKLTQDEQKFFSEWQGQVIIAHSLEEILQQIN